MPEQQLATVFRRFLKRAKEALGLASRKTAVGRETAYFVMQSTDGRFAAYEQRHLCSGLQACSTRVAPRPKVGEDACMSPNDQIPDFSDDLLKIARMRMPFGKYAGELLIDLPEVYITWFYRKGFPEGEMGRLLSILYEVHLENLTSLFEPLRVSASSGSSRFSSSDP